MADEKVVVPVSLEVDDVSAKNLDLKDLSNQLKKYFNNMTKSISGMLDNINTDGMDKAVTDSFNKIMSSIEAATNAQAQFSKVIDDIESPNVDYENWRKGLEAELDQTRKEFENIAYSPEYYETKSKAAGGDPEAQAQLAEFDAQLDNSVNKITELQNKLNTTPLEFNIDQGASLDSVTNALDVFEAKMAEVDSAVADFNAQIDASPLTPEFQQATNELASLEDKINALDAKSVNISTDKAQADADALEQELDEIIAKMQQMANEGQAVRMGDIDTSEGTARFAAIGEASDTLKDKLDGIRAKAGSALKPPAESGKFNAAINLAGQGLKGLGDTAIKIKNSLGKAFKHGLKSVTSFTGGLKSGFMQLLKYAIGIQAIFSMVNKLRQAFISGFEAMGRQVPMVGAQINSFKNALSQVRGSIATAFQPIASVVIPLLVQLMGYINSAMTALAHFFATFTGQKQIYKYTAAQKDYTKSIKGTGGAAKKATKDLMGFDEINRLSEKTSGGGGGGAGAGLDTGSYEAVATKLSSLAQKIKQAWAVGDFTQIGLEAGNALAGVLNSIPWTKMQATAEKFGKSVATFINGFVSAPGLFREIGVSLGEAVNTVIALASGFVENLNYIDIGQALSDAIMGFFETTDFAKAGSTISTWYKGVLTTVATLLKETDFAEIGSKLAEFLTSLDIPGIAADLAEVIWEIIKAGFTLAGTLIKEAPLESALLIAFAAFKWGKLGSLIGRKLSTAISTGITKFFASELGKTILKAFGGIGAAIGAAIVGWKIGQWLDEHVQVVRDIADWLVEFVANLIDNVVELWNGLVSGVNTIINGFISFIQTSFNNIKNFITTVVFGIKMGITNAWNGILSVVSGITNTIMNVVLGIWNGIKSGISAIITGIQTTITTIIEAISTTVSNVFSTLSSVASSIWNGIKNAITGAVTGIKNAIVTQFTNAYNTVTGLFNNIAGFFAGIWNKISGTFSALGTTIGNAISGAVKTAINGVIGMIESIINKGIGLINSAIGAINKLPGVSVSKLDLLNLPRLAQGAVLPPNQPFAAIVGDQKHGTNVETPLSTIQEAVANVMDSQLDAIAAMAEAIVAAINNKDMSVVIGDDAIGRAATRYNRRQAIMRG